MEWNRDGVLQLLSRKGVANPTTFALQGIYSQEAKENMKVIINGQAGAIPDSQVLSVYITQITPLSPFPKTHTAAARNLGCLFDIYVNVPRCCVQFLLSYILKGAYVLSISKSKVKNFKR